MPDSGSDRGRSSTRTIVATILAETEWAPAETPQDATVTAREARDLAVRLRPVLSKLAQQSRGSRRRDQDWLPAVEQLAVDAQYFASWWLPRLEGKSAQSWPSWSADGYADWVKRLDSQRLRTLEMVRGAATAGKIASVTPLIPRSERAKAKAAKGGGTTGTGAEEEVPSSTEPLETSGLEDSEPVRIPDSAESGDPPTGERPRTPPIGPIEADGLDEPDASDAPSSDRPRVPRTPPIEADGPILPDPPTGDRPRVPHTPPITPDGPVLPEPPTGDRPQGPRTPPIAPEPPASPAVPAGAPVLTDLATPAGPPSPVRPRVPRTPPNGPPRAPEPGSEPRPPGSGTHRGGEGPGAGTATRDRQGGRRGLAAEAGASAVAEQTTDRSGLIDTMRPRPEGLDERPDGNRGGAGLTGPGRPRADRPGASDRGRAPGSATAAAPADLGASRGAGSRADSIDLDLLTGGVAGPPTSPVSRAQTADVGRMVRYVLAAIFFVAGLVLVLYATHKKSPSTDTAGHPVGPTGAPSAAVGTPPATTGDTVSAPSSSGPAPVATSAAAAPAATPATSAPATSAAKTSAAPTQTSARPVTPVTTGGGAGGASTVTALSVTSLAPDQSGSTTYVLNLHVKTSGTGPVTVTLTVAGSSASNTPGSVGAQTITVPLSGQTSYDTVKFLDDHLYCPAPYLGVKATAPGGPTAYKDTTSAC